MQEGEISEHSRLTPGLSTFLLQQLQWTVAYRKEQAGWHLAGPSSWALSGGEACFPGLEGTSDAPL